MDELTIEDLKQLVIFYNKRSFDAESKNAEFQLINNRLKIEKISLESRVKNLESEIISKSTAKKLKAKE
jgi:hypothetical protein